MKINKKKQNRQISSCGSDNQVFPPPSQKKDIIKVNKSSISLKLTPEWLRFSSYLPGLELCRFRSRGFYWRGHDGRLHGLLLRLLWTRDPERRQRIDTVPESPSHKHVTDYSAHVCLCPENTPESPNYEYKSVSELSLFPWLFSHLTSSRNLSSSRAGNWESLKQKTNCHWHWTFIYLVNVLKINSWETHTNLTKRGKKLQQCDALTSSALPPWPQQSPS